MGYHFLGLKIPNFMIRIRSRIKVESLDPHQGGRLKRIILEHWRVQIWKKVSGRFRIRIKLEGRIWIRIRVEGRIRIRIEVKSRIRVMRIPFTGFGSGSWMEKSEGVEKKLLTSDLICRQPVVRGHTQPCQEP